MKPYFPMFIDLSKKKIVVIGGGVIAERRIRALLQFADNIYVVSPTLTEELELLRKEKKFYWIQAEYDVLRIHEADMVLAATNDDMCNEQVVRDCQEKGILVNTAHKKELCDFYFPAIVIKDDVVVGISSDGNHHGEVKKVREILEEQR